jgi:hypothetical protein
MMIQNLNQFSNMGREWQLRFCARAHSDQLLPLRESGLYECPDNGMALQQALILTLPTLYKTNVRINPIIKQYAWHFPSS